MGYTYTITQYKFMRNDKRWDTHKDLQSTYL